MSDSLDRQDVDSKRRKLLAALGGTAAVGLAGCSGGDGGDDDGGDDDGGDDDGGDDDGGDDDGGDDVEGGDEDDLNLINATFDTLDPIVSDDTASGTVINQMYENLTAYPHGVPELENLLLEEFEVSEDGLEWEFTIKEGVEFHDGTELTAADVIYSWERVAMSEFSSRPSFFLGGGGFMGLAYEADEDDGVGPYNAIPDSLGLEQIDDYTIGMEISSPNPGVLDILTYGAFAVMPEGLFDDHPVVDGENDHQENHAEVAIGTGPFEFDEFTLGEEARVTRFDDYHGQVADIDGVHWAIIEDSEAAFTYAVEGNADIFGVPTAHYGPDTIDTETDDRGREVGRYGPHSDLDEEVNYLSVSELSTFYFGFNARNVPRPVRQAVAYVTDHSELVEQIFEGRGVEAFSFTPPPLWPTGASGYEDWVDNWGYSQNETDIEGAQDVLAEAGYTADDPFEMNVTAYQSPIYVEAAQLTRDKLAGLGVEMDIEQAPFATLQSRGQDGDMEMYTLGWIWSWEDVAYGHFSFEPEATNTSLMPGEANGFYLDWQADLDDEDAHAAKAQEAWDTVEANPAPEDADIRNAAYIEIEEAIHDDMILLPFLHGLTERFWYDHVDVPLTGALGSHHQVHNETTVDN